MLHSAAVFTERGFSVSASTRVDGSLSAGVPGEQRSSLCTKGVYTDFSFPL